MKGAVLQHRAHRRSAGHRTGAPRRGAVTGQGAITPLANSAEESWSKLRQGKSGIGPINGFDVTGLRTRIAGRVEGFEPGEFMDPRLAERVDRFIQLGVAAAVMAVRDARLPLGNGNADRVAVVMGNTFGGIVRIEEAVESLAGREPPRLSPYFVPGVIGNMAAGLAPMSLGARGPNVTLNQACASGAAAIGQGLRMLRAGEADAVVAGGCEAALTRLTYCGFHALKATSARNEEPARASRPFDLDRDGFVPAEGAAALVLEPLDAAERRGAAVLAEVAGYGTTCDAYHVTQPDPTSESCARCMQLALDDAGLGPGDIDCINAHGTSTRLNDVVEARAIREVFGEAAERIPRNKCRVGRGVGAGGAMEAVFSILSLRDGVIPPTANYELPDPSCDLGDVPTTERPAELRAVLSNSFGFGGINASLVFRAIR